MADIKKIMQRVEQAVNRLALHADSRQDSIYRELLSQLKQLDTRGDAIANTVKNWKLIQKVKVNLEKMMVDGQYKAELKTFVSSFNEISQLSNEYFSKLNAKFTPKPALSVLKQTAIETTVINLTQQGLSIGVSDGITKLLQVNVTSGGSYADLADKLRNYLITNNEGEGAFARYVKTYATTSVNQFTAEYNQAIADDLGLEWYGYTGSLIEDSREFCIKCVQKRFIHVSEFEKILRGDFDELGKIRVSKSTGLPPGLMKGTDKSNLIRRRGGWNCGHQMIAIDDSLVPEPVKQKVYATDAYKSWAAFNRRKAR